MEQEVKITIYVEPEGKARPRTTVKGGKTWSYTPGKTVKTEALIRETVLKLDKYFSEGVPLRVTAIFYREKPKSASKKVLLPATRPDLDNYFKLLTDALEKFVYKNDSQITTAIICKRFGSPPRIYLEIREDKIGKEDG